MDYVHEIKEMKTKDNLLGVNTLTAEQINMKNIKIMLQIEVIIPTTHYIEGRTHVSLFLKFRNKNQILCVIPEMECFDNNEV